MTDLTDPTVDPTSSAVDTSDHAANYDRDAQAFQNQAPRLLTWEAIGRPALVEALREVFEEVDPSTAEVVDQGAASGRIVKTIMGEFGVPAAHIDAVEISPEQVALAQADPELEGTNFMVGNIAVTDPDNNPLLGVHDKYDVATQHMVAEHLNDEQLAIAARSTLGALRPGGYYVMVFTHPDRVVHTEGDKVRDDGSYTTTFPWGGEGDNYLRTVEQNVAIIREAGFDIKGVREVPFPVGEETKRVNPDYYAKAEAEGYFDVDGKGTPLNVRLVIVAQRPQ